MKSKILFTVISLFASQLISIPSAFAGEEASIELGEVPEEIMQAAGKKIPDATFNSANTETESDGSYVYEIQGILADGRKFEYDVYPDGEIQEIEIEFPDYMVPGAVLKAIENKLPGFKPAYIEASHTGSMKVFRYEFVGEFSGKSIDIEVSADGSKIEIADS